MADPFIVGGAAVQAVGGLITAIGRYYGASEAQEIIEEAQARYGTTDDSALRAVAAERLGPTELAKITTSPEYQQAQKEALAQLRRVIDGGGMTLEDRANLQTVNTEVDRDAARARAAALQNLRGRGIAGSGMELAANLSGQQSASNRKAQAALQAAGSAQQRALQAMRDRASLAGNMRQQEYGEKARAAQAQDSINQLNWGRSYDAAQADYMRRLMENQRKMDAAKQRAGYEAEKWGGTARDVGATANAAGMGLERYGANERNKQPTTHGDGLAPVPGLDDEED